MNKFFKILIIFSIIFGLSFCAFTAYADTYSQTDYYTLSRSFSSVDEFVELIKQDPINQNETSISIDPKKEKVDIYITNYNAQSPIIWLQKRKITLEKIQGEYAVTFSGIKYKCHQGHGIGGKYFYISSWMKYECKN